MLAFANEPRLFLTFVCDLLNCNQMVPVLLFQIVTYLNYFEPCLHVMSSNKTMPSEELLRTKIIYCGAKQNVCLSSQSLGCWRKSPGCFDGFIQFKVKLTCFYSVLQYEQLALEFCSAWDERVACFSWLISLYLDNR